MRFRVGIDIGGTFSDLVVLATDGRVETLKVSSAPDQLITALLDGLQVLLKRAGLEASDADAIVHGTTVATNAILEYRGARTALITTRGFRDVLEIRRLRVGRLYDLSWEKPAPLVPRRLRFEVTERLDAVGAVITQLDEADAERAIDEAVAEGVEALAVSLLHAYANNEHERRIGQLVAQRAPGLSCSLSSELLPEIGEYERTSTTVINAYISPVMERYLGALQAGLREAGVAAPLLMMQSTGGVMHADSARRRPIEVVESGPAAGVVAALEMARQLGELGQNIITVDMGGTTAKASILEDGRAFQMAEYEVGAGITAGSRMFKGAGHLLRVPALDIAEVGAGGGSLVHVDAGGGLRVGPESAGAVPGPVCYGLGNQQPTLTDANLVLGYLNPRHLLGGSLNIDFEAAWRQLEERVARPLGLDLHETAYGVHLIAVSTMVRVARAVSTERGRDPRRCTLVAFGGNGPVHAAEVARQLSIEHVIVPPWPGLFSAFGLLFAEPRHELVQAWRCQLSGLSSEEIGARLESLAEAARARFASEGYPSEHVSLETLLDLRYRGQSSELRIPFNASVEDVGTQFEAEHQRVYGHHDGVERIELVNLRVVARAVRESVGVDFGERRIGATPPNTSRPAYFGQHGLVDTPVVSRDDLTTEPSNGPLIVEEYDATTIVPPGWTAHRDYLGNIHLQQR